MSELDEIKRILAREREARKEAERILEERSLKMFNQQIEIDALRKSLLAESDRRTNRLNRTQKLLNDIFDLHPFSILIYSPMSYEILEVNKTAQMEYGYTLAEFLKMKITDLHPKEDMSDVKKYIEHLNPGEQSARNWTHLRGNGESCTVRITGTPITFKDQPARIVIIENISETVHLQRSRDQERQKYMDLVERSSDLIFRVSRLGRFNYVNTATCNLTGYREPELLGMHFSRLVRPDYVKRVRGFYQFQLESDTKTTYSEFPVVSRSGNEVWLGLNVDVHTRDDGEMEITVIAREITERKVFEKALLRSEEKYRSIIENMQLGLLEVDKEGIIRKAYSTFCQIVGYAPEEIEGTRGLFMLDEEALRIMRHEQSKRVRGETGLYEIRLITKSGEYRWVLISGAPFYDENNRFVGTIGIHLDITDRKIMEGQLREAKNLAESSLRSKELFLANVSHEIRTPLNAIIGLSELLADSSLSASQMEMTETICKASRNLLDLINDILLLSKADVGGVKLRNEPHSLHVLCADAFELFGETARQKGLEYRLELPSDATRLFQVDRLRFTQIVQNLLSNAIKFTDEGEVFLRLSFSDTGDFVCLEVGDTGIGIPEEELQTVFQDFSQASNNRVEQYGGTGLGLSIVHKLLELMSGRLEMRSTSQGTLFRIELPLAPAVTEDRKTPALPEEEPDTPQQKKWKILVAEDNPVNQLLISKILDKWEQEYTLVDDGIKVLECLREDCFDLVLMDVRMPVMDGLEASRRIRDELKMYQLPILGLTANAQTGEESNYYNAGMNAILGKPFEQKVLLEKMQFCLGGEKRMAHERLDQMAPEDKEFTAHLRAIFIEDSLLRMSRIAAAIDTQDAASISSIVHSMKPSLFQLGSPELVDFLKKIEKVNEWSESYRAEIEAFLRRVRMLVNLLEAPPQA